MINVNRPATGFKLSAVETCNFDQLHKLLNADVLALAGQSNADRMANFITTKMGAQQRYYCDKNLDALDLARQALGNLLKKDSSILKNADFFIYAGISNPMPVVTHSALLACEFGFNQPSCWDIKSGCSSGVLALIQAHAWFQMGASRGIIVTSETLSKFANPSTLQMSAAIGDGAAALIVERSEQWRIKSIVHGTQPEYVRSMLVKGKIPVDNEQYEREDFRFTFQEKAGLVKALSNHWVGSLTELLSDAGITGKDVNHYIAHQVDGTKNSEIAKACGIPDSAVAKCFGEFGNMGCPTIFVNFHRWLTHSKQQFEPGDHLVWHAVGGGLSWAGICLEFTG